VFTGHSLGGACAEVLAFCASRLSHITTVEYVMFGALRVRTNLHPTPNWPGT
jgi:hypothetical protein